MTRRRWLTLLGLVPLAAIAAPIAGYVQHRELVEKVRPLTGFHADYFPNVTLRTQDGRVVHLYDDLLKGRTVLVNFFLIDCVDGVCPVTMTNLARLQRLLGSRCGRDVVFYSFALDPARDTPARLARYHAALGAGPGWTFLTGSTQDMELCRRRFGFVDPDPAIDRKRTEHTRVVLLGNEPHERWMASPAGSKPEWLLVQLERIAGTRM